TRRTFCYRRLPQWVGSDSGRRASARPRRRELQTSGYRGASDSLASGEGIRLIGMASSILTGIPPQSGPLDSSVEHEIGSEAPFAGIGLRISRSGVRIPPGAPTF